MEFQLGETYEGYEFLDILKRSKNEIEYRVRNTHAARLEALRALPQTAQDSGVRDRLETTADRPQGGRILQGRPRKQRLGIRNPHGCNGSQRGPPIYISSDPPPKSRLG